MMLCVCTGAHPVLQTRWMKVRAKVLRDKPWSKVFHVVGYQLRRIYAYVLCYLQKITRVFGALKPDAVSKVTPRSRLYTL